MEYMCLDCGYSWQIAKFDLRLGYRRCPRCRSYNTVPSSFWEIVELAERMGINENTPIIDIITSFQAVRRIEGVLKLGIREFQRIMRKVIEEAERRRKERSDLSVES